eukprot:TRINITY_DN8524_c0_g1_i2.p1 TRINITY_DN8524_c0_g1~~TRINITY_DN8524_c0_g1_i2.p1  ORF type:complete len:367 (+),score=62.42 TRINITY_DN8524_c0_g1_i2:34-1134(+)
MGMKARSSLVFATLLLLVLNIYPTLGELKLVIQFNRHGARGPIYDLPDREYWNQFGQLTPVGMRQLYLLGAQLRQRYIIDQKFLPEKYNPDVIFVRSTAVNRTIMSAMSLLYGLYPIGTGPDLPEGYPKERAVPPINFQVDIESLGDNALPNKFQPVPVHMTKINKDYELRAYDADVCPKATELAEKTYNSDDFKKIDAAFKDLYPELANAFGIPVEKVNPFMGQQMMDNLLVDYMADKPLKIAYKSDLWKKLYMLYNIMMIYSPYASEEQQNLFTTKLYADILKYITAAQKGSPLKWVTYSAHDTTLNLVIAQLKVTGWSCLLSNYLEGRYDYFYGCPFVSLFSSSIILEAVSYTHLTLPTIYSV